MVSLRGVFCSAFVFALFIFLPAGTFSADALQRRILVIPFDNMQADKNYNWMSDSFAENLKTELLKSGKFAVMDAALLRKINPDIQFAKLTEGEATTLAQRLNCEAAVIGRYFITRKAGKINALIQIEGVDAIAKKSIVIKGEYADIDGGIFERIQVLAGQIAGDFNEKLPALSAKDAKRDGALERLIARLENPPKGFFDILSVTLQNKVKLKLQPEFDIDIFDYDLEILLTDPKASNEITYEYEIWGKIFKPALKLTGMTCTAQKCVISGSKAELVIAQNIKPDSKKYTLRFQVKEYQPLVARWWITAGYPLTKSLSIAGQSNPAQLVTDGPLPLDAMRGLATLEAGIVPGRWQLPVGINWALATQFFYGNGNFSEVPVGYPGTVRVNLFSAGGGIRIDRPFMIGSWYGVSPVLGLYVHYQRYFRGFFGGGLNTMALVPEIGLNQYLRLGKESKWRFVLSVMVGSFLYSGQNLSYLRGSIGVEYAFK